MIFVWNEMRPRQFVEKCDGREGVWFCPNPGGVLGAEQRCVVGIKKVEYEPSDFWTRWLASVVCGLSCERPIVFVDWRR